METPNLFIDITVPQGWHELSDKELRYIFELIAVIGLTLTKVVTDLPQLFTINTTVDEGCIEKVARKAADKALYKKYEKLDEAAQTLLRRMNNFLDGIVWAALPKWADVVFFTVSLAAIGFGYGFFSESAENSRLKDVEWLYRRERTLYRSEKERQILLNHERDFLTGTPHERDCIEDNVRYLEQRGGFDKTYLYFNSSED